MRRERLLGMLLLLVLLLPIIVACGAPGGGTSTTDATSAPVANAMTAPSNDATIAADGTTAETATAAGGTQGATGGVNKVTIKLGTWAHVEESKELQTILDRLNAESQTYQIVQESSPAEYFTKLQTTLAAGTGPDVMWIDQDNLPAFAAKGALLDITDRLKADNSPAAALDDYFDVALERYTYDGKLYGLPWISMPVMLYVNLDAAKAAGLDEATINDWDWEDFRQACVAMTVDASGKNRSQEGFNAQDVKQYGFSVIPGWPPVQMWIWQAGGEVLTEDLKQSPIDTPEAVQGAQYLQDLVNKDQCTPAQTVITERGFGEMVGTGEVAMFMGGAADAMENKEGRRIKAFLLPKGPKNRDTWAWIGGTAINAATKNPDAAYEAFMDLTEAFHHWKAPAPRKSLANAEGIVAAQPYKQVSAENIVANMENLRAPRIFPGYPQWGTVFGERFVDPLVRGQAPAQDLASQARPLLEEVLAESAAGQ